MSEQKERKARALGINHVVLEVDDLDQALEFYGQLLDFTLRGRSDHNAFIDLGDQFIQLTLGRSQSADTKRHFGLVLNGMGVAPIAKTAGAVEELRKKGMAA